MHPGKLLNSLKLRHLAIAVERNDEHGYELSFLFLLTYRMRKLARAVEKRARLNAQLFSLDALIIDFIRKNTPEKSRIEIMQYNVTLLRIIVLWLKLWDISCYITTAVPLAVTISIEPLAPRAS